MDKKRFTEDCTAKGEGNILIRKHFTTDKERKII